MFITYNLNKYWTWRQKDKNNKRLMLFAGLYLVALAVNVSVNSFALGALPDDMLNLRIMKEAGEALNLITVQTDKLIAFVLATGASAFLTFLGQKFWLFKNKD